MGGAQTGATCHPAVSFHHCPGAGGIGFVNDDGFQLRAWPPNAQADEFDSDVSMSQEPANAQLPFRDVHDLPSSPTRMDGETNQTVTAQ